MEEKNVKMLIASLRICSEETDCTGCHLQGTREQRCFDLLMKEVARQLEDLMNCVKQKEVENVLLKEELRTLFG